MKTQRELIEICLAKTKEAASILEGLLECDECHVDGYVHVATALGALYHATSTCQILEEWRKGNPPQELSRI